MILLIRFRSPLENHTRFQTKTGKVIPVFKPKRPKSPTLWAGGRHIPIWLIQGSTSTPSPRANQAMISTLSPFYTGNLKSGLNVACISSVFFRCLNASARVTERYVRFQKKDGELRLPQVGPSGSDCYLHSPQFFSVIKLMMEAAAIRSWTRGFYPL